MKGTGRLYFRFNQSCAPHAHLLVQVSAVDVHRSTARWTVQSDDKTIRVSCETNQFTTEPPQKPHATMQDLTELIKKHVISDEVD